MVGMMLTSRDDPKAIGRVMGIRGFQDGGWKFYGLHVVWNKELSAARSQHSTVFLEDLDGRAIVQLSGPAAQTAEQIWAQNFVQNDLELGQQQDTGISR